MSDGNSNNTVAKKSTAYQSYQDRIIIQSGNRWIMTKRSDILYIQVSDNTTVIIYTQGRINLKRPIESVIKQYALNFYEALGNDLYINPENISVIKTINPDISEIKFSDGTLLTLSTLETQAIRKWLSTVIDE